MTKPVSSKIRKSIGAILRQVRISVSTYTYNDVITKTSEVDAVEEFQTQIGQKISGLVRE